jgi:putative restriction endonuclease
MRYWWVNQNQTFRQEFDGGYLWSPKRNRNGARNPFYESMREVAPGDIILSFCDTLIAAVGVAKSYCFECPKPLEFGGVGAYWENVGWKITVSFILLENQIRPQEHMQIIRPLLPEMYSPLQVSGYGNQGVYLTELHSALAQVLFGLIGPEITPLVNAVANEPLSELVAPIDDGIEAWERKIEDKEVSSANIPETEKLALVSARRGQGLFKERVMGIERRCRITGVENPAHLIASHCKPWRYSSNAERLDGENGLLLTPSVDHLFDRGFISFEDGGTLIISPVAHKPSLSRMGIATEGVVNVGKFSLGQRAFLDYHRTSVLKMSRLTT